MNGIRCSTEYKNLLQPISRMSPGGKKNESRQFTKRSDSVGPPLMKAAHLRTRNAVENTFYTNKTNVTQQSDNLYSDTRSFDGYKT